ncbi:hypothetical protein KBD45_08605 [Candidatus Dojkabacteria bacterium]|nr:hypothetical protein [Candidatus Dojkabacteria bacterium]
MPKSTIMIGVAIVALVVVGAGGYYVMNQPKEQPKADDTNKPIVDEIANAPVGCPKSTSIVVKSEEAGTQNITSANSVFIHGPKDQGRLIFTNYTLDPDSVYSDITGDKVLTVIKLSHEDKTTLDVGTYRKTAETGTEKPNLYSSEYNISTVGLAGAVFDDNATVKIDYLGVDYVCGSVTSKDSSSSINGNFIAKYISKI